MAGACSDCVRCSIRHRRVGDLGPEHAGPRPISTGHSLSAYIAPVYRGPPVIFTFSRWPGGPRVLAGRGSTTLAARASFLFTFHAGLPQLFCDFDSDGTCLAGVRACHLRFVCSLSLLCKYHHRPPFNQTLRTLWAAIPLDRLIDDTTPHILLETRLRD